MPGAAVGEGDLDMQRAYALIKQNPNVNRINIEGVIASRPVFDSYIAAAAA